VVLADEVRTFDARRTAPKVRTSLRVSLLQLELSPHGTNVVPHGNTSASPLGTITRRW
jgi:hypothetical protein